jgi:hypothetical protein
MICISIFTTGIYEDTSREKTKTKTYKTTSKEAAMHRENAGTHTSASTLCIN